MTRSHRNILQALLGKTALIVAAILLAGCIQESGKPGSAAGKSPQPGVKTPDTTVPGENLLIEGAGLFAKLCTSCHGSAGNGGGNMRGPSLQRPELTYGRTPAAITQSIRDGRPGGMPAFGHVFTPRQLEALSTYVQSLKK